MSEESLKNKTITSVGWKFLGSLMSYGITFIVGIILARLLSPDEYGLIGIIMIFITVFNGIVDGGFSTAIIRKKNATDLDYSTMLIVNVSISIVLYIALFLSAHFIADFFNRPELVELTRVTGLCIIINAFCIIQQSLTFKELAFKTQTICAIFSSVFSGIVGIIMAFCGYGVWALVAQQLSKSIVYTIMLWFIRGGLKKLAFSWNSFVNLWNFGWKILVSTILSNVWNQLNQIVIGRCYTPAVLGQYTKGSEYVNLVSQNITLVVQTVSYPSLSRLQDEPNRLRNGYRMVIKVTMFVTFILVCNFMGCAKQFVLCFLGEKWLPCVPMMYLISLSAVFFPLHAINLNLLQVKGRSDIFLWLEIVKKIIYLPPLIIGVYTNMYWMLIATAVSGLIALVLNAFYSGRFIDYSLLCQLRDITPSFLVASLSGLIVFSLSILNVNIYLLFGSQIIVGIICSIMFSIIFKLKEYNECLAMLKMYMSKFKRK